MEKVTDIQKYLQEVFNKLSTYYDTLSDEDKKNFRTSNLNKFRDGRGVATYDGAYPLVFILQYALARGFEYSAIYEAILKDKFQNNNENSNNPYSISVTSIGAGTGIDYWGLCYAIENLCNLNCKVNYTGVEPSDDWSRGRIEITNRKTNEDKVSFPENKKDFGELLSALKRSDEKLDDVYIFPVSIKESCIGTTPADVTIRSGVFEYNSLLCMADFADIIKEKIEIPIYLAFAYRQAPGSNNSDEHQLNLEMRQLYNQTEERREIYDTLYGTYLISALEAGGLRCEQVGSFNAASVFRSGHILSDDSHFETSFFAKKYSEYITGRINPARDNDDDPEDDDCYRIYDTECNEDGVFDRVISYSSNCGLISIEEWKEKYIDRHPMTSTGKMCFQIFKVSPSQAPEVSAREKEISDNLPKFREAVKRMIYPVSGDGMLGKIEVYYNQLLFNCSEHEPGLDAKLKSLLPIKNFIDWLIYDGFIDKWFNVTEKGERYGFSKSYDKPALIYVQALPFARKLLTANIASGRYLKEPPQ